MNSKMTLKWILANPAVRASLLAYSLSTALAACGSPVSATGTGTGSTGGGTAYVYPAVTPSTTPTPLSSPASNLPPPLKWNFKLRGTGNYGVANQAVAAPADGIQSDGPAKTFANISTDTRLVVDVIPISGVSQFVYQFNDWSYANGCDRNGECYTNTPPYKTSCLRFDISLKNHGSATAFSTQTVTLNARSADGTGSCGDGSTASTTIDFSGFLRSGHGALDVQVSNVRALLQDNSAYCNYYQCGWTWLSPVVSLVTRASLVVRTNGTQ